MSVPTHDKDNCKTLIFSHLTCSCSKKIYYFVCTCGSCVMFEDLYPYWTKHNCDYFLIQNGINELKKKGYNNDEIYSEFVKLGSDKNKPISPDAKIILDKLLSQNSFDFYNNSDSSINLGTNMEDVETIDADRLEKIIDLEKKMINAQPTVKNYITEKIERGKIAEMIKDLMCNKCLICEKLNHDPYAFFTKGGKPFVEVHHVIPVSTRDVGVLSSTNLITVCPNHHRELHYGDVVTEVLYDRFHFHFSSGIIEIKKIKIQ